MIQFILSPESNQQLATLCGEHDTNLKQIEQHLKVTIYRHGFQFTITGEMANCQNTEVVIEQLYQESRNQPYIEAQSVHLACISANDPKAMEHKMNTTKTSSIQNQHTTAVNITKQEQIKISGLKHNLKPRGKNQNTYLEHILQRDINFGIGPAGTGKTYLAVAMACQALLQEKVQRILLVRPAVEAGEKLGFLPGDLAQKVDPYLRPLYDALYDLLGTERVERLLEKNIIEIAPLAFMRGRTINDSFIILDESQNTTNAQMKMFLTRIGFGSKAVITGDMTQTDLPDKQQSGLSHAIDILKNIKEISFTFFDSHDVIRHPLVKKIVDAYDNH